LDRDEVQLMNRYCDGDAAAFRLLYALLAPRILGYLVALIADRPLAEDLLQQTFLKLHQSRSSYVRNANPIPWIYTIAHRTCLDEIRRRKRAPVKLTGDGLPPEARASITGQSEEHAGRDDADPAAISLADLDGLPPNQKEALILTKVHGHSVAEAALIAGTTPGAIKLRAHRAYVTLRQRAARQAQPPRTVAT
jgi:RNA polymerase sigma-70 factor (ECF subfamily)